jgi:hypothetical protein
MATTRLSDTMITALLDALTHRGSDGRYQLLTRGATRAALEARGKVEREDGRDNYGRPRTHHYLTADAVTYLRNALEYTLNQRGEDRDRVWQEWLNADRRHEWALIDFLGLTADTYEITTTTPQERKPHRETLGRADAWERIGNTLRNGQRITLDDGAMTAHTKLGATWTFTPIRPAAEEAPAAPEPRPAAEVLAADPIPADTSVLEGMPGQPVGREGVPTTDAVTHEAYVVQIRNRDAWQLPNHDDGAHMTRASVISSLAWARQAAPGHTRASVDTDGTVYVSTGRQAARYIPASLLADYSADTCPGCGTAYATNGDGPCDGWAALPSLPVAEEADPEAKPCEGCGAPAGEPCEPMSMCEAAREEAVSARLAEEDGERGMVYGPHRITNTGDDIEHTAQDGGKYGIRAFECTRCHKRAILADFEYGRVECTEEAEAEWARERAEGLLNDHFFKGATAYEVDVPTDDKGGSVTYTHDRETAARFVAALLGLGATHGWFRDGLRLTHDGSVNKVRPVVARVQEDEEAEPLDEMGTDALLEVLREHAGELPADSTFAKAWALMDRILTDGGIECLPAPWDGYADQAEPIDLQALPPRAKYVTVGELQVGDVFVTRCAWIVRAIDGGTFTAERWDGEQTVTQTVPESTKVLRTRRAQG